MLLELFQNSAFSAIVTLVVTAIIVPVISYFTQKWNNKNQIILNISEYKSKRKIDLYLETMNNIHTMVLSNQVNIVTIRTLFRYVYILSDDLTKAEIDKFFTIADEYIAGKQSYSLLDLQIQLGTIENKMRDEIKSLEKNISSI